MNLKKLSTALVLPTISATCDQDNFYIGVQYGSQGNSFATMVGPRQLTPELKQKYSFQENRTHFSLVVPYNATDSAFEARRESGICCRQSFARDNLFSISQVFTSELVRARIDVLLYNSETNWVLADLYLACNFPLTTTSKPAMKCFHRLHYRAEY